VELEGIHEEIDFFKMIFESSLEGFSDMSKNKRMIQKLTDKQSENQIFVAKLNAYIIKLQGINECDDIQCETFYLNDYLKFKMIIETFLLEYKETKKEFFIQMNQHYKPN
jgi:hypothetical protein